MYFVFIAIVYCISWHTNFFCLYLQKWDACVVVQACIGGLGSDKKKNIRICGD